MPGIWTGELNVWGEGATEIASSKSTSDLQLTNQPHSEDGIGSDSKRAEELLVQRYLLLHFSVPAQLHRQE